METGVAEKHTGYGGVETEFESRPTIVDEMRSVIKSLRRLQGVKGGGFIDAVLRGLGQVVFQNNSLTGLLVLLAISVNSFVYAGAALFGAVVSTYTATTPAHRQQASQGRPVRLQRCVDSHRDGRLQQQRICAWRPAKRPADPVRRACGGVLDHLGAGLRLHDKE